MNNVALFVTGFLCACLVQDTNSIGLHFDWYKSTYITDKLYLTLLVKLDDKQKHDALLYAELGRGFYVVSSAVYIIMFLLYPLFLASTGSAALALFFRVWTLWTPWVPFSSIPLILAWLTNVKIVKPLRQYQEPSRKWFSVLETIGYFLGFFITGVMLYIANKNTRFPAK